MKRIMRIDTVTPNPRRIALRRSALTLILTLFASAALLPGAALCGYSRGGSFLIPGYGARAGGMGGALIASGGDEGAVYWNPAYLACLQEDRAGVSYVNLVPGADARHSMLAYARSLQSLSSELDQDRVSAHAVGFLYSNLSLGLSDGRNYSENVFRFAYAYTPDYFISVGAAANVLVARSDIGEFDATGSSFDFGFRLKLSRRTSFGFVARNAFSRVNYTDGFDQSLRRRFSAAFSMRPIPRLLLESATEFAFGGVSRTTLGGEYALYADLVYLRSGISLLASGESRSLPHFGLGFAFDRFSLDYNANLDTEEAFEDTHRFSLSVRL